VEHVVVGECGLAEVQMILVAVSEYNRCVGSHTKEAVVGEAALLERDGEMRLGLFWIGVIQKYWNDCCFVILEDAVLECDVSLHGGPDRVSLGVLECETLKANVLGNIVVHAQEVGCIDVIIASGEDAFVARLSVRTAADDHVGSDWKGMEGTAAVVDELAIDVELSHSELCSWADGVDTLRRGIADQLLSPADLGCRRVAWTGVF